VESGTSRARPDTAIESSTLFLIIFSPSAYNMYGLWMQAQLLISIRNRVTLNQYVTGSAACIGNHPTQSLRTHLPILGSEGDPDLAEQWCGEALPTVDD